MGGGKPGKAWGIIPAPGGPKIVFRKLCHLLQRGRRQEGAAAVEFALCIIPLLLIVAGIIDFGESWYIQSVLATASREGARYATRYQTDSVTGERLTLNSLNPTIQNYVLNTSEENGGNGGYGLRSLLPNDANPTVTPGDAGYPSGTAGAPVSVKVAAQKTWFLLNYFMPTLTNPQPLSSTTTMACE
jgi:Flp pilus assembly protein TadG